MAFDLRIRSELRFTVPIYLKNYLIDLPEFYLIPKSFLRNKLNWTMQNSNLRPPRCQRGALTN